MAEKNTAVVVALIIFIALGVSTLASWFVLALEAAEHRVMLASITKRIQGVKEEGDIIVPGLIDRTLNTKEDIEKKEKDHQTFKQARDEALDDSTAMGKRRTDAYQRWGKEQDRVSPAMGVTSQASTIMGGDTMDRAATLHNSQTWTKEQWKAQVNGGLMQIWAAKRGEINEEVQRIEEIKQTFLGDERTLRRDRNNANAQLESQKRKFAQENEKDIAELGKIRGKVGELEVRLKHETEKLEAGEKITKADGIILSVGGEKTNFVVINIGWVQGVRERMRFDVFEETKGGKRMRKGKLEVKTVFAQISDCQVLPPKRQLPTCPQCGWEAYQSDMKYCIYCFLGDNNDEVQTLDEGTGEILVMAQNPMNPIRRGDRISNPYFEQAGKPEDMTVVQWEMNRLNRILAGEQSYEATTGQRLTFVFGGDTIRKSKREIKLFIEENGGVLQNQLTLTTHYLIAGTGTEADKLIKRARELGVRIMKEEELYEFFGKKD